MILFYINLCTTKIIHKNKKSDYRLLFRSKKKQNNFAIFSFLSMLIVIATSFSHCKKDEPDLPADQAIFELKKFNTAPLINIKNVQGGKNLDQAKKIRLNKDLKNQMEIIVNMIVQKDFSQLKNHVDPESGLWVDLKSHRKFDELDKEISDPESYLNVFFLDSELLQKKTGEKNKASIRDVLLITDTIDAEIFLESKNEFEVKLTLARAPQYSYFLNNPVFRYRKGRYYIYRLP